MITKITDTLREKKSYLISLFLSIFAALLIGAVLMIVTGYNPIEGYAAMLKGAFGSSRVFGNTMAKMLTLCLTGLAMAVLRLERAITCSNIKSFGTASVPAITPLSWVLRGPLLLVRYVHRYIATELSMMVVITSLTLSFTFSTAGIHA